MRKIDEDIKNINDHVLLSSNDQINPKIEPIDHHHQHHHQNMVEPIVMEAEQILSEIQPAELVQLLQHQNTLQQNEDIFMDHQDPPQMMELTEGGVVGAVGLDDVKICHEMYQPQMMEQQTQLQEEPVIDGSHQITCRTVAFPLCLLAGNNSMDANVAGGIKTEDTEHDNNNDKIFMHNLLNLQHFVPVFRDTYCDIFSKLEPNILNDASHIFPTLATVDDHANDNKMRFDENRSVKSCMYPSLPKPSHVNTFGMRRIGGGATISRRQFYLRKTLLKNRENDKKLKLKVLPYY